MQEGKTTSQLKKSTIGKELQTSDIFYKHIVELSPDAVVIHSDGKIMYANQAALTLMEAKNAGEVVGQPVMKFIHKDSIPLIKSRIEQMLSKHKVAPFVEEKFISLKGRIVFAETKAIPFTFHGKQAILAIVRDISTRKKLEEKQNFLEKVSILLNASVDYKTTLTNICKLLVPYLADYIRIALVNDNDQIEEVAAYHSDPKKIALVSKLYSAYKGRSGVTHGVSQIIESGTSEIIEQVTPQSEKFLRKNSKIKQITEKLGLTSYMGIPLKINKKVMGVITISSSKEDRMYTKDDLEFAQEIAGRIAYAVENALLFAKLQKELDEKIKAQERETRLVSYLDQTFDAIILWKYSGEIVYWNKGAQEFYGYTKEEAMGKNIHSLLKTIYPVPFSQMQAAFNKKGRWEGELIHVMKNNKPLTVSCKKVLITEKDGGKYVFETNRDITERLHFEKNLTFLSESSKSLATSLDYKTTLANIAKLAVPHMADWCSVDVTTEKGIEQLAIAHVDPQKVAWAKELNKKNPPDPEAKTGVPNVIRTGKSEYYPKITDEMLVAAAQDKEQLKLLRDLLFSSIMIVPIRVNNETIGAISFVSAESGRFYTKSDLVIAEELSARAGLAIENAQLYQNAKRAVNLRDEFISLASHELKTPITSLKMYAQSLGKQFEKRNDMVMHDYFMRMDQQIDRLALLVNDLLNVSKIQHGKLEFDWKDIDINTVVKDTIEMLQNTNQKHTIVLKGKIEKTIHADSYRIYQVITNLLTNATKYSPDADKIIVHLASQKNFAKVTVQDFGIGIGPSEQKRIFEPFYRANHPNEKRTPGLGMGLFISHEIIKRHGGAIRINSIKGKGSQFIVSLPYAINNRRASQISS